ncbi:hypothetical protein GCM10007092_17480 [Thermus composti]|nr:hypothetical protein GCM10007092_17480 [Thermus composti]
MGLGETGAALEEFQKLPGVHGTNVPAQAPSRPGQGVRLQGGSAREGDKKARPSRTELMRWALEQGLA